MRSAQGLVLRPETEDDLPFLRQLYASTRAEELLAAPWSLAQKHAFLGEQFRLQRADWTRRFTGADFQVIERAGRTIGRLYLDRRAPYWRIIDIAFVPEARRKGFGAGLIRQMQADAAEAKADGISLHVLINNDAAARLYKRLGFTDDDSPQGYHQGMTWRCRR